MTARDALAQKVREARRFRYIPDSDNPDPISRLLSDEWDTAEEVEERGGADCDGQALWTIQRADEAAADRTVQWHAVAGLVKQRGSWNGHMWVMLVADDSTVWADPTWHLGPGMPADLGYPSMRLPCQRWTHRGLGHYDDEQWYETQFRGPAAAPPAAAAFLSSLDARKVARDRWRLLAPLRYESDLAGSLTVPEGFETDFASVPRAPFAFLLAGNTGHEAAALHDYLYRTGLRPRDRSDDILAEALGVTGEPAWRRVLMWQGVRVFGASAYRPGAFA